LTHEFPNTVLNFISELGLLIPGEKVLAAVSGGVDSVVLLDLLRRNQELLDIELGIAHFDHGLRGEESEMDAQFVRSMAEEYRIPFHLGKGNLMKKRDRDSVQVRARRARFAFFDEIMQKHSYDKLALGHNRDDQVETIMMALLQGYSLKGIKGIQPISGKRIHPLLNLSRNQIVEYAKMKELKWVEDSTNFKTDYLRNRMRIKIIPELRKILPKFETSLISFSHQTGEMDDQLNRTVEYLWKRGVIKREKEQIILAINDFLTYFYILQRYIFANIIRELAPEFHPSTGLMKELENLCLSSNGSQLKIGLIDVLKDRNRLIFTHRSNEAVEIPVKLGEDYIILGMKLNLNILSSGEFKFSDNPSTECADLDKINGELIVRNWKAGDKFYPLGMNKPMKLSDFFINRKVSRFDKTKIILLCDSEKIIWICGMRLDDRVKIDKSTKRVLRMCLSPNL